MRVDLEKTWDIVLGIFEWLIQGIGEVLSLIFYGIIGLLMLSAVIGVLTWLYEHLDSTVFASLVVGVSIIAHALIIAESK